jgi:hypothetical protein
MKTLLVRLKRRDPRRAHVLRRFTYKGARFEEGKGWYQVSEEVGDHLRNVRQRAGDEHSPLAFEVCTAAEARAIDEKEAQESVPQRPADNARVAVTRDDQPKEATPKATAKKSDKPDQKAEEPKK